MSDYGFSQNQFGLPTTQNGVLPTLPASGPLNNMQPVSGAVNTGGQGGYSTSGNGGYSTTPAIPPQNGNFYSSDGWSPTEHGGYGWQYANGSEIGGGTPEPNDGSSGGYGQQYASGSSGGVSLPGGNSSGNGASPSMSFADGGVVPEPGQGDNTPDLGGAAALAKQVLAMGRQRNGLPPTLMGDQNSYNGEADGLQTPDADGDTVDPTAFLSQGYADGGDVTEGADMSDPSAGGMPEAPDAQPSQDPGQAGQGMPGPQAAKMVGYLGGAEAVTPEIAQAMQQRVDPTGRMDPNSKTLLSIASAPQGAQWGMMQHYRQKYDATKAFALAAAQGTQGKPADMNASTQAATQAHQNLPDGNNVVFSPHPQGVAVHVQPLTSSKTKGYDEGGEVEGQKGGEDDVPLPTPDPRGPLRGSDDSIGEPDTDALSGAASAVKSFVMSIPQYLSYLKGQGSQYDAVMDKGAAATVQEAANTEGVPSYDGSSPAGGGPTPDQPSTQTPSAPVSRLLNSGHQQQVPAGLNRMGKPYTRTVTTPSAATAAPGPTNTPQGLNRTGKPNPSSQPAQDQSAAAGGQGGGLNDFVGNFNKQNNTNYSVGSQAPAARPGPSQPAVYAGTTPQNQLMGARSSQAQPQGEKPFVNPDALPKELVQQANALYPNVGDEDKRTQFIVDNMKARAEQSNRLDVAKNTHAYSADQSAAARIAAAQATGDARVQSSQINSGARVNVAQIKAQADIAAAKSRDPTTQSKYRSLSSWITANPGARPDAIQKQMQILGINPQAVGMQSQAPAPAQQAPAQQPPVPGAKFYQGQWWVRGPNGKDAVPYQA